MKTFAKIIVSALFLFAYAPAFAHGGGHGMGGMGGMGGMVKTRAHTHNRHCTNMCKYVIYQCITLLFLCVIMSFSSRSNNNNNSINKI